MVRISATTTNSGVATQPLTPSNMDNVLVEELNELSLNEREKTMEEIHGVHAGTVAENERPDKLTEALRQMRRDLEAISPQDKPAYRLALQTDGRYVSHTKFLLKFLRAEKYDPKEAAFRMVRFLEYIHRGFGPQVLTRPICRRDLPPESTKIMTEDGILQILPVRDSSGRRVAVFLGEGETAANFHENYRVSFRPWFLPSEALTRTVLLLINSTSV